MQDYPVIDWVMVVSVSLPITRFNMNFYIPLYQLSPGGNDGIPEISPLVIINPPRVDYLYRFTAFSSQLRSTQ